MVIMSSFGIDKKPLKNYFKNFAELQRFHARKIREGEV